MGDDYLKRFDAGRINLLKLRSVTAGFFYFVQLGFTLWQRFLLQIITGFSRIHFLTTSLELHRKNAISFGAIVSAILDLLHSRGTSLLNVHSSYCSVFLPRRKRFLKKRTLYSPNQTASFNPAICTLNTVILRPTAWPKWHPDKICCSEVS